ncbi:NAC domain-containing protein 53-like [Lycium barbarum]|uniref:NAC domain-containing protein 53-like n=1 Tax=Lycium barbarum TaxID=112863 RepID=UPI00293F6E07|nr:NAC domain-containing protein 53-like [Lycium barbarum]
MSSKSKLPLGFRFHPTDEELINYLKNFVLRGVLPSTDVNKVVDLFGDSEPWQIIGASKERTSYFLTPLKRFKNSTKKFARTVGKGTWKGQTSGKPINDGSKNIVGFKRSLKYHSDIKKDLMNDKWLMTEYFLPDEYIDKSGNKYNFILCKIKEKQKSEKDGNEVMEEDVDEVIASILGSNYDNHQVITKDDKLILAVVNEEVNYEVRTNFEARQANNYLEAGVEQFNGINPYENYSYDSLIGMIGFEEESEQVLGDQYFNLHE